MNIKKFKNIAKEIRQSFIDDLNKSLSENPNASLADFKVKSHAQMMQTLSQAMYSKPYEEIKETILSQQEKETKSISQNYIIYSGTKGFCLNGKNLVSVGEYNSDIVNEFILFSSPKICYIPDFQFDEYGFTNNEAFEISFFIAEKMGYFSYHKTIFQDIDDAELILLDHIPMQYRLDGEWISEVVSENNDIFYDFKDYDKEQKESFMLDLETSLKPVLDHIVWHDEFDYNNNLIEIYLTFNDLCKATPTKNSSWKINVDGSDKSLHFI